MNVEIKVKSAKYIENETHAILLLQTHNSQLGIDRSPSYDIPQLPAGRESDIRSVALLRASCFGKTKQKNTKYKIQVLKYKVQILKDRPTLNKRQWYWFSVFNCDVHFSFFYDCKVKATMKFNPKTKNIATQPNIKIHFEVVTNDFFDVFIPVLSDLLKIEYVPEREKKITMIVESRQ